MVTLYSRLSRGSAPRELSFETLLWITVVFMSSVSLAGAGVRGVAELKNGFGERASTLSLLRPYRPRILFKGRHSVAFRGSHLCRGFRARSNERSLTG